VVYSKTEGGDAITVVKTLKNKNAFEP